MESDKKPEADILTKLDAALHFFTRFKDARKFDYSLYQLYVSGELSRKGFKRLSQADLDNLRAHLVSECYVSEIRHTYDGNSEFKITVKGELFYSSGGYTQQQINAHGENKRIERLEKNQMAIQTAVVFLTAVIAFAEMANFYATHCLKK